MLVLSRKESEEIVIGEWPNAVRVMVVSIDRGKVRLGITAHKDVKIMRTELLRANPEETHDLGEPVA